MKSNRRRFIQNLGVGAAGITLGGSTLSMASCASPSVKKEEEDGQILFIGDNIALADTQFGKVKGICSQGYQHLPGDTLRCRYIRYKPFHAASEAGSLDNGFSRSVVG